MARRRARFLCIWLALGVMAGDACGPAPSDPSTGSEPAASSPGPTSSPSPSLDLEPLVAGSRVVRFPASDGVRLGGRLFPGGGPVGLVLSHMGRGGGDQAGWYPAAPQLAAQGYTLPPYAP